MRVKHWFAMVLLMAALQASAAEPTSPLFVVHFQTGPQWKPGVAPQEQQGFADHSANLGKLRKDGVIAFGARYEELGMVVIRATSLDAARALIAEDPGVRAGIFEYRVAALNVFYPWRE